MHNKWFSGSLIYLFCGCSCLQADYGRELAYYLLDIRSTLGGALREPQSKGNHPVRDDNREFDFRPTQAPTSCDGSISPAHLLHSPTVDADKFLMQEPEDIRTAVAWGTIFEEHGCISCASKSDTHAGWGFCLPCARKNLAKWDETKKRHNLSS